MNITLTPELESLVNRKVQSGRYNSAGEVIRDALQLMDEKDRTNEKQLEELRMEIIKAEDQIKNGQFIEIKSEAELREFGERIIRRGHERLAAEQGAK